MVEAAVAGEVHPYSGRQKVFGSIELVLAGLAALALSAPHLLGRHIVVPLLALILVEPLLILARSVLGEGLDLRHLRAHVGAHAAPIVWLIGLVVAALGAYVGWVVAGPLAAGALLVLVVLGTARVGLLTADHGPLGPQMNPGPFLRMTLYVGTALIARWLGPIVQLDTALPASWVPESVPGTAAVLGIWTVSYFGLSGGIAWRYRRTWDSTDYLQAPLLPPGAVTASGVMPSLESQEAERRQRRAAGPRYGPETKTARTTALFGAAGTFAVFAAYLIGWSSGGHVGLSVADLTVVALLELLLAFLVTLTTFFALGHSDIYDRVLTGAFAVSVGGLLVFGVLLSGHLDMLYVIVFVQIVVHVIRLNATFRSPHAAESRVREVALGVVLLFGGAALAFSIEAWPALDVTDAMILEAEAESRITGDGDGSPHALFVWALFFMGVQGLSLLRTAIGRPPVPSLADAWRQAPASH